MQKRVLLLHGWGGSDWPHWQSHLASDLAANYGCVNFLRFSEYDTPKLDVWMQELLDALQNFQPEIVVCHSLANTLWFHLCHKQTITPIEKLFLVAPPSLSCSVDELQEFFPLKVPSRLNAKSTTLVTSTNDPYMDTTEAKSLQEKLNIPHKILVNAGHINSDSGFGKWEWIYKEVSS